MASTVLRRATQDADLEEVKRRLNTLLDIVNGNIAGRIKLRNDDGIALSTIGTSVSSGNYALDVKAASGLHGVFTHSTGSPVILAITDSAALFDSTVTLPSIDPPTVSGQATARSQTGASGYIKGATTGSIVTDATVAFGDNYNLASVSRTSAGNYTVTIDRDFATANYAVQVTVEDNGAVVLIPKVNSKAAGSFDVHIWTTAGTLTDPDAFSVSCDGVLS
jgi:hypothetical protein